MDSINGIAFQTTPHLSRHAQQMSTPLESLASIEKQQHSNNTQVMPLAFSEHGQSESHIGKKRKEDRVQLSSHKLAQQKKGIAEKNDGAKSPEHSSQLTSQEKKEVEALKKRDEEVRRHEQAHHRAAGQHAQGGPQYNYQVGPDGKRYAVDGKVNISVSEVPNNPKATLEKARQVRKAALAPQDPSEQDRRVAAEAQHMETKARQELSKLEKEENSPRTYNQHGSATALSQVSGNINILA